MQRSWIGRSEVWNFISHTLDGEQKTLGDTTRPDTLMGVTYVSVAGEHPLAQYAARHNPALQRIYRGYQKTQWRKLISLKPENLVWIPMLTVTHPLTGEQVPVWVANYVLMSYGSGAVMAVPAHDERDFEFANKYNLPIKQVIDVQGQDF